LLMPTDSTAKTGEAVAGNGARVRPSLPRHFHLLWDEDLEEMQGLFRAIRDRRNEVVADWYQLYALHFGDARTLSEAEFARIFEPALFRNKNDLLEMNMDRYAEDVRALGEILVERGVPLQEIIASLHLFEEAVQKVFPQDLPLTAQTYAKFDRLSHIRIILLVDVYSRLRFVNVSTRIKGLESEAARLPHEERKRFYGIVGASAPMLALYKRIEAAARTSGTVLILGESGSGKELVAHALHESGPRSHYPFVAFNCAAIPKDLIESELFGYKRGAFSGANTEFPGLFRAAEGGTLFLDEITEMGAETQSKLLRAIQERAVRPVGATREAPVDVRLIASTNRDPEAAVRSNVLREDLYYRLQANVLRIPALRERLSDIPLLVEHFISLFNQRLGKSRLTEGIEEPALAAMSSYKWPGNVRELANSIESAMTFGSRALIGVDDLPSSVMHAETQPARPSPQPPHGPGPGTFAEAERDLILRALGACDWNKVHAAAILKISRKKLYAKINKYQLERFASRVEGED
jgi:transcriptional regulator with PAS, ATPase and Fis domain